MSNRHFFIAPGEPSPSQNSPRAAVTAEGTTQGDQSMRSPTIPQRAEAPSSLDAVQRMRIEMGTTVPELIGERVEDARLELFEAMKTADRGGESDLHARLCALVSDIDDFRSILAERSQS